MKSENVYEKPNENKWKTHTRKINNKISIKSFLLIIKKNTYIKLKYQNKRINKTKKNSKTLKKTTKKI